MNAAAIAVTGWGFGRESLQPFADALAPEVPLELLSPDELSNAAEGAGPPGPDRAYAAGLCRRIAGRERPSAIIGWSMGALIALEAALLCPRRVGALVLVSATARFCRAPGYPSGMPARLVEAMIARLSSQPAETVADFVGRVFLPGAVDESERQSLAAAALRQGAAGLVDGLRYLAATDLRAGLERVGCPTLILHGDQDPIVPAAASARLHEGLPTSRLETISGAGHALPLRHAEDIGGRILAFLRGLPPA